MSVKVESFGCRLNALEGDSVKALAEAAGLQNTTIINGCAVTSEAMRQTRQAARKAARTPDARIPNARIIVTGCAAQADPKQFHDMPEVDHVMGNEEKLNPASYTKHPPPAQVADIMTQTHATPLPPAPQPRARAFVQVQTGCDHRCTFCIIPFGRGNSRSVPITQVISRCQQLVDDGHKEIVLTGVDVTSYGPDIGEAGLGALVHAILAAVPDLQRLRLSSIDAVEIDQNLLDMVIHEPRLMPHLHLSLQSGDDMILKRMKRRHTRAEAIDFCAHVKAARPDITFGADLIAGFPTETEAMFDNSLKLVDQCALTWLHVFPYSPRPNTAAARMPQLDGTIIKTRAAALRKAGDTQRQRWLDAQNGREINVLVEKQAASSSEGRSENFARVLVPQPLKSGTLVHLRVTANDGVMLHGELI